MMFLLIIVLDMVYVHCSFVDFKSFMFGTKSEDKLIDILTGMSYMDCVKECLHRQRCLSVNYRAVFHICELREYNKSMLLQTQSRKHGYLTTSTEDWNKDGLSDCNSNHCAINEKCVWDDGRESCITSDCGNGIIVNDRQPKYNSIGLFSKSHYACQVGFTLRGKAYGSCQPNGDWEEPVFVCEIIDCGMPDLPNGHNANLTSTVYRSIGNLTCGDRYTAADPANAVVTIECTAYGLWTVSTLNCVWGGCPPLETVQNPECVNLSMSNGEYIGNYARYKGTKINGQFVGPFAYRDCKADQTWSDIGNIDTTRESTSLIRISPFIVETDAQEHQTSATALKWFKETNNYMRNIDIKPIHFSYSDSDCEEVQTSFTISGIYSLQRPQKTTLVYCDMDFGIGGWTVIQRRETGQVNFKRVWNEYKNGFGDVNTEYWIGNEIIHEMTHPNGKRAIFLMEDKDGNERYSEYSTFIVASETDGYQLTIGGYVYHGSAAGDSLIFNANGHKFTTIDLDQDSAAWGNCAEHFHGGWWYGACHTANPNGMYGWDNAAGMVWSSWRGMSYSMARMVIMLKD